MHYKKIFFPIGGGEELKERIHGALLIAKHFKSHLQIFKAQVTPKQLMQLSEALTQTVLEELNSVAKEMLNEDLQNTLNIVKEEASILKIMLSKQARKEEVSVELTVKDGYRSKLIEQESKYCDLVIAASPHNAKITATFEATITKSGKPALVFPRKMKIFKTEHILIAWNNSPEVSRALSQAIPLLQKASKVHVITSKEFISNEKDMDKLMSYLEIHGISSSYEVIRTTRIPGEALLKYSNKNKFDLIVAGAFGHKGLKELMLGGTTKYILEHTKIPIFMAH
ncbi:MAG: universal stress protein [Arcobacter sp.]|nr:MAG: universal stress protein [Arcobacter sp.]